MSQLLFSPIKNRWFNTYESKSEKSQVFKYLYADMDDPTYLTFKIEFGDWGASVLSRNTLKLGVTSFNAYKSDFDSLPIGLLNCPAPGDSDLLYWQNNANNDSSIFNHADIYSAFAYLRSRNEDTRAEYLYYFVNGLLEIQKETPYLFKKINGIDLLEQFDPKSGQRLKTPAKITLECYEGLNLKIRTLMEMYRKAAWDDVYQRWILPLNMREFKMIIYIFERRTFQEKEGETINGDLPVKAYECCPCEFDIQSFYKGDYDNAFNQGGEEMTTISISVKNVKTYFSNGLLDSTLDTMYHNNGIELNNLTKKLDTLMIYDLVETVERQTSIYSNSELPTSSIRNMTINGARALFLNKNILFENEDASPNQKKTSWTYASVQGQSNIGESVMNILSGAKRWVLATEGSSVTNDKWNNIMSNLIPSTDVNTKLVSVAADGPVLKMYTPYDREPILLLHGNMLHNRHFARIPNAGSMAELEKPRDKDNFDFLKLEDFRDIEDQNFMLLNEARTPEYSNNMELNPLREISEQDLLLLEDPRNTVDQSLLLLEPYRSLEDLPLQELDKPRDITLLEFLEIDLPRQIIELQYPDMPKLRELPEQDHLELNPERIPDNLPFGTLLDPREYAEQQYAKLDSPRKIISNIDNLLLIARHIPDFKDFKMEDYRLLTPGEMQNLSDVVTRLVPTFKSDRSMLEERINNAKTEISKGFTDADNNLKNSENDSIDALKKNTVLMTLDNTKSSDTNDKKHLEIKDLANEVAYNSDKIKNDIVDSILKLKDKLKSVTLENVRKLPETDIMSLDPNTPEHNYEILMSIEDIRQIENNIKLIGLQENDIRLLSFQSIINLLSELESNINVTHNMIGITDIIEREVSNNITQSIPEERQTHNHPMMNLPDKSRKVNKDTIVY